ncbi:hypothetical protein SEA_LIGMA_80 [Gordonia phage Ligma]|nr:hypothetical protein SEA_LIGMA_80 [Gordonia phage Ligma]UQT02179.1 hypothetical protein SEA_AXUMITE_80 [Gordonia phage Axumite]
MAHELDQTNGVYSFADSRNDAWHQLGQQVGHLMTADEALTEANMKGWDVRKIPLRAALTDGTLVDVPDKHMTIRTNPVTREPESLGIVGNWYSPFQNEETTALLDAIRDESSAAIETAGALRGGRETFVTMKLPESMSFTAPNGTVDTTETYIAVLNSHDGSSPLRVLVTPVRIVCANTQTMALSNAASYWSIRHTTNMRGAVDEARRALGLTFRYIEAFETEVEALIAKELDEAKVRDSFAAIVEADKAETERQREGRMNTVGEMMELYRTSDTVSMWKGTAFGAYNAVTEYSDHFARTLRKDGQADQRALRTLAQSFKADGIKSRARDVLAAV